MQARNGTNRFSSESAETTNRDSFSPSDEMSYVVSKATGPPGVRWTCCRRKGVVRTTGSEGCRENSTTSSPYSATRLSRSRAVSTRAFHCRFRTASIFASADPATAAKLFSWRHLLSALGLFHVRAALHRRGAHNGEPRVVMRALVLHHHHTVASRPVPKLALARHVQQVPRQSFSRYRLSLGAALFRCSGTNGRWT